MSPTLNPSSPVCPLLESLAEVLAELQQLPSDTPDWYAADKVIEAESIVSELRQAIFAAPLFAVAADVDLFCRRMLAMWEATMNKIGPVDPPPYRWQQSMIDWSKIDFSNKIITPIG
jgi:hypothetical protein